jgi:hypothetical protein
MYNDTRLWAQAQIRIFQSTKPTHSKNSVTGVLLPDTERQEYHNSLAFTDILLESVSSIANLILVILDTISNYKHMTYITFPNYVIRQKLLFA